MKQMKGFATVFAVGLLSAVFATTAMGSAWNQKTKMTVNQPIEVPGMALPAGEYIFETVDSTSDNQIVEIKDAETGESLRTVLTIPNKRLNSIQGAEFRFYETAPDKAPALRAWFYPGREYGHEFVYPESRALELARETRRNVPSAPDDAYTTSPMSRDDDRWAVLHETHIIALSPDGAEKECEMAAQENERQDRKVWGEYHYYSASPADWTTSSLSAAEERMARQIRKRIRTLPNYGVFDALSFNIRDDQVTLMGKVNEPTLKTAAARVVQNLEGVQSVVNNIEVLPLSANDDRIRLAVYENIYGHPALSPYEMRAVPPIHIIVENGHVTLEGVVARKQEKTIAGMQANTVNGVFSVDNSLRVEEAGSASDD
jgi:hyperosmotically inducible protein